MNIEIVILGSGTAVPTVDRGAAGYLLIVDNEKVMFDCGPGSTRKLAQAGFELIDLDRVCISHFHPDHVCDLTAILFGSRIPNYSRTKPLELVGPVGLKQHYEKLLNIFGNWLISKDYELIITELHPSNTFAIVEYQHYKLMAQMVDHSYPAFGYRVETPTGIITYSGDTDYCEGIISLCENADIAVLECSTPDERKIHGHLTPSLAGQIAQKAKVKHLVLSHFYPECQMVDLTSQCRKFYNGQITLAKDLMRFPLRVF
ncbi:MAG: MBL fold metallo-hydrolase [Acidobacteria bacterium]|nr:MBL fold metallo-hydrolase [Acidobacteriota bacterium]